MTTSLSEAVVLSTDVVADGEVKECILRQLPTTPMPLLTIMRPRSQAQLLWMGSEFDHGALEQAPATSSRDA